MLFLFCVALWFILRARHVLKSSRALCHRVSSFFLALWSPRLGKRELVCVLLVHLFVCFVLVSFLSFFSSSWCRGLAAVCDCGTPWTFLLTFFRNTIHVYLINITNRNYSAMTVCLPWITYMVKYLKESHF